MPDRAYSEQEIAQILHRALERQDAEAEKRRGPAEGLNVDELERLATESGIAPEHLRAAAAEVDRPSTPRRETTTATHNLVERTIPGHLNAAVWDDIVADLRGLIHMPGEDTATAIGTTYEWRHTNKSGITTTATLTLRDDSVALRLSQRVGIASLLTESLLYGGLGALLLALVVGKVNDLALLQGVALFAALLVGLSTPLYALLTSWRKKMHRRIGDMADRIEAFITAASVPVETSTPVSDAHVKALLDLPEEEPPSTTSPSTANRTRA
ncbi:MAG: hypothetical protein AAGJ10_04135 [Bacteroidota bacterium]